MDSQNQIPGTLIGPSVEEVIIQEPTPQNSEEVQSPSYCCQECQSDGCFWTSLCCPCLYCQKKCQECCSECCRNKSKKKNTNDYYEDDYDTCFDFLICYNWLCNDCCHSNCCNGDCCDDLCDSDCCDCDDD